MYNILICDDDKDIVNALKIYLKNPEYRILEAYNGKEALEKAEGEVIHLVLMDIMMPIMDGLTALATLREHYNMPVILLTAKAEDMDKILGLNVGADDYITKPFNPMEVVARVNSQIRRYTRFGGDTSSSQGRYIVGGLELDDRTKEVLVDSEKISLTPTEFDILKLLMANPNRVFSPKEIYTLVRKESYMSGNDNTIAVHIRHLREKIEINPAEPRYSKVIFGQGYKLEGGRIE